MIRNYRSLVKNYAPIDAKNFSATLLLAIEMNVLFMHMQQVVQEALVFFGTLHDPGLILL